MKANHDIHTHNMFSNCCRDKTATVPAMIQREEELGVEIFGEVGEAFDPNLHNAVMHTEEEGVEENTITQVFQKGFKMGEKIIRFAMVQVAN